MELVVGLNSLNDLERLANNGVEAFLYGSSFSLKYHFSFEELKTINNFCINNNIKSYISIDSLINESCLNELDKYFNLLTYLSIDGIYYCDLGIISYAKKYHLENKLIYDSSTLSTNKLDINFFLKQNQGCVLAREICLDEIIEIVDTFKNELDMQVFGHLRMSYSKRPFISNYFNEINLYDNPIDKNTYTLVEATRSNHLPIKESENGVCIYTDYIFMMLEELAYLKDYLKRAIIDSEFLPTDLIIDVVRNIHHLTKENAKFLADSIKTKYPNKTFKEGYLYIKTSDKKIDEQD